MGEASVTYREVWDTLSAIDVTDRIKKKNDLSYLSWAWAWQVMMENYPQTRYIFHENEYHKDTTCTVHCTVMIDDLSRDMWLPAMKGFTNKAIENPSGRDIGDAKMRCLTKAFAMFGLGHYIYAGEDLPQTNERNRPSRALELDPKPVQQLTKEQMDVHRAVEEVMISEIGGIKTIDELKGFWQDSSIPLKKMETEDPERYENVLTLFKEKRGSI
jgi:hypothetical protein